MVTTTTIEVGPAASSRARDGICSPQLVARMRALLDTEAGFTIDLRTGRPVTAGLAVCADPALTSRLPLDECDHGAIASWLAGIAPALEARSSERRYVGGWHARTTGLVHLDVVRVVPVERRRVAERLGRHHRQHAIFDLAGMTLVPLVT